MLRLAQKLFWALARLLFRLRYRVRLEGGERLGELTGPTLVMPCHPAYVDPPMVLAHLRLGQPVRPVVYGLMYRNPGLYPLMRLVEALEVPDLSEQSRGAREQTLAVIDKIVDGLRAGGAFLIYPSGRAQQRGIEEIGAARAVSDILEKFSDVNLVLVRTRGLWGSMASYAQTGKSPNLGLCVLRSFGWLCANLFFFTPRRNVTFTVEVMRADQLPGFARETLNPFLEKWYNQDGPEKPTYVPYHPWFGPRTFDFPGKPEAEQADVSEVPTAVQNAVRELIEEHLGRPLEPSENSPEVTLEQLGLDSLGRMELAMKAEDRFGFHSDQVATTLGHVWALAAGRLTGSGQKIEVPPLWNRPARADAPIDVLAETIYEAFVRRCALVPDEPSTADQMSGALSYRRLWVGAALMARRLGQLPGRAIGVLLPASVAADVTFLALHRAGKLPVMLNWTTGPANLAHAVKTLGVVRVLTSRKLIDRLGIEVPGAEYVFLEDVRAGVGKLEAAIALVGTYVLPWRFRLRSAKSSPSEPAVVLFTSGSESAPKAVPLSHGNLIANIRACIELLQPTHDDALLGFLPPFHSFGLMGTLLAPILGGVRLVHHPDPTDAAGLVRIAAAFKPTLLVSTPTFLSYMLGVASPGELDSLRIVVTGAEKCPDAVFEKTRQMAPHAAILEGYGITECSPVVSANRIDHIKPGTVGPPVRGVEICLVDPETKQPTDRKQGMLLVRGPSIFAGYMNYSGPDPFVELGGHRWYVTGDLVEIDSDRFIRFAGRLKRFLKAGGEMISLPALEEPFTNRFPATENGPQAAVEGVETPDGRHIVLFTTQEISLRDANAILAGAGFRGLMRLDEVVRLDAIPVLGTGKTDYKALRARLS